MATNVHLTPELEKFARKCVKSGAYNNVSEVVRSALRLLQEAEIRRKQFEATLKEAEEEADRKGAVPLETVLAKMDKIIDSHRR